jgi:hypothetical protein
MWLCHETTRKANQTLQYGELHMNQQKQNRVAGWLSKSVNPDIFHFDEQYMKKNAERRKYVAFISKTADAP